MDYLYPIVFVYVVACRYFELNSLVIESISVGAFVVKTSQVFAKLAKIQMYSYTITFL